MSGVLGFELSHAIAIMELAGFEVLTREVKSRKGVQGNERRVVREQKLPCSSDGKPQICLTYAVFCTQVNE